MTVPSQFEVVFDRLQQILRRQATARLAIAEDTPQRFALHGKVGPATLKAWGGKQKMPTIAVAWVQVGKAYVSYHHMAFYGSSALHQSMSPELKKHLHGKTCFNFKVVDEPLFKELETLTARGFRGMADAGFVA
jgi:hypothetical protein